MAKITDVQESKHQKSYSSVEKSIQHYSDSHKTLLVGEGDFSFSLVLAKAFGSAKNMVPTSMDSKEKVLSTYPKAHETLSELERLGATILHGVDATKMEKNVFIGKRRFDRIVFNFPHAGFFGKERDKKVSKRHRKLMKNFFKSASTVLSPRGEIHVTHRSDHPYDKWKLVKQAKKHRLVWKESVPFSRKYYRGYVNRRGAGDCAGESFYFRECLTYKFILSPAILELRELMAKAGVSPDRFSEVSIENYMALLRELISERQAREAAEKAKADLEPSLNGLIADDNTKKSAELTSQRNSAVHQNRQAWKEKENVGNTKRMIIPEIALKLQADDNTKKSAELTSQRNSAVRQKRQAWREKENDDKTKRMIIPERALKLQADDNTKKSAELTSQRNDAVRHKAEALKSNKEEIKRKKPKREEAILKIEPEKQARKMAKENDELKKQREKNRHHNTFR